MIAIPGRIQPSYQPKQVAIFEDGTAEVTMAISDFVESLAPITEAIHQFGERLAEVACDAYRREHGRLPGSNRTARLRKKRLTRVNKWFAEYLTREQPQPIGFQGELEFVSFGSE